VLHIVLVTLRVIVFAYSLLVFFRVVLGWVISQIYGRPWDALCAVTDPYLSIFYRLKFLRKGNFDFTPFPAMIVLVVAFNILSVLAVGGWVTLGLILADLLNAVWSGVWILIVFFLFFGVLRVIPILFRGIGGFAVWRVADMIINPVVLWVSRLFRQGRRSGYTQHLLLTLGLLFVIWLLGELVFRQLISLFQSLPL
jgi:YggT family protein